MMERADGQGAPGADAVFRQMIEASSEGVVVIQDGRIVWSNPAFGQELGYTAEDLLDLPVMDLVHPDDREVMTRRYLAKLAGEDVAQGSVYRLLAADGRIVWVKTRTSHIIWRGAPALATFGSDVSELIATQEELSASQDQFAALVDNLAEGVLVSYLGHVLYVNSTITEFLGVDPEDLRGQGLAQYIHPDYRELVAQRHLARLQGEDLAELYEIKMITPAGKEMIAEIRSRLIEWRGEPAVLTVIHDLTQRRAAQQAVEENEARLRLLVDSLHEGCLLMGPRGEVLTWNRSAEAITGVPAAEVVGETLGPRHWGLVYPDMRPCPIEEHPAMQSLASGEPLSGQVRGLRRPDGTLVWVSINTQPIIPADGGRPQLVVVSFADITEAKADREALEQARRELALIMDSTSEAIIHYDRQLRVRWANRAGADALGGLRQDLAGRTCHQLRYQKDEPCPGCPVLAARDSGQMCQGEITTPDGSTFLVRAFPVLDAAGRVEGMVEFSRDISLEKQRALEQERLEEQLRQAQKMEALGTLAGGIAHDFNNILAAIMGYAELGLLNTREMGQESEELDQILASAKRARKLVRQILTFSRKVEADLRRLDLNRSVAAAAELLGRTIPRMIAIQLDLEPDLAAISGDATQMEQVLLNLGINAGDAMAEGGELTLRTRNLGPQDLRPGDPPEVAEGAWVLLEVCDTGEGMSQDILGQIFDPFFTTKGPGKGTGLGLSTVYGIVRAHRGRLVCRSQPGQGTCFRVFLPSQPLGEGRQATGGGRPGLHRGQGETVLLVDDELDLRRVGRDLLGERGYRVITAASGEEALEVYARSDPRPAAVILDLGMPGMGGWRCLAELKRLDPAARVIVASGYLVDTRQDDLRQAGAAAIVRKPFALREILDALRRVLDGADRATSV